MDGLEEAQKVMTLAQESSNMLKSIQSVFETSVDTSSLLEPSGSSMNVDEDFQDAKETIENHSTVVTDT